jgi:hypothetical protein
LNNINTSNWPLAAITPQSLKLQSVGLNNEQIPAILGRAGIIEALFRLCRLLAALRDALVVASSLPLAAPILYMQWEARGCLFSHTINAVACSLKH